MFERPKDRSSRWRILARVLTVALWIAALACFGVALLRTLGFAVGYPLTVALAVVPYVGAVALVLAIAGVAARRPWPALVALIAFGLVVVAIVPRAIGGSGDGGEGTEVTAMSVNLLFGKADAEQAVQLVRGEDVDLLSVQEIDAEALRRLRDAGIDRMLPHSELGLAPGAGGTAIFSAHPLRGLPGVRPGTLGEPQARALVRLPNEVRIDVTAIHVRPPTKASWTPRWERGLAAMPAAPETEDGRRIGVLIGDFNATLDHPQFRDVVDRGYVDVGGSLGDGLDPTWPVGGNYPPVTIDHVLVSEQIGAEDYDTAEIGGTDHRAIWATLIVPEPE